MTVKTVHKNKAYDKATGKPTLGAWGWVPSFIGHPLSYTDGGNTAGLCADDAAASAKLRLNSSLQKVLRNLHYAARFSVARLLYLVST